MLNELENKIRKAIPELKIVKMGCWFSEPKIQLNHVLEYVNSLKRLHIYAYSIVINWNLKSNLLSDQSIELITFVNELKND